MAGMFRKLNGYVYDGSHKANEALTNGMFVCLDGGEVEKVASTKDTIFRVAEKTTLYGMPAIVLDVVSVGSDEIFLLENEFDVNDNAAYDESTFAIASGDYARIKRPLAGEQLVVTVTSIVAATLAVGDLAKTDAGGTIAKYTPAP